MKRRYIYTIVLSVFTLMGIMLSFSSCENGLIRDDECVSMMDSAAIEMHDLNYGSAKVRLEKVLSHSSNRIHRVSADLLMMRICIMTGKNKEFYDYRSDAEKCMNVIKNEEPYMTPRHLLIWHYIQSSYYRVSADYFNLMHQDEHLQEMLDTLALHQEWIDADSLQLDTRLMPAKYVEGQRIVANADQLCEAGEFERALDSLTYALHQINVHHIIYNKGVAADDTLTLYGTINDSISKEMAWINDPDMVALPQWMAIVREELSIVYGAMGDKAASNYNRNIYFDILDATREDMQMKSREEALEKQSRFMNMLMIMLLVFAIIVCTITYTVTKKKGKQAEDKHQKLKECLRICSNMVKGEDEDERIHALLPHVEGDWTTANVKDKRIKAYEREMLSLLQVFHGWIAQNTQLYESQMEQMDDIEGEIYMHQHRMEENKRRHIDRATAISIVQGITPFLDRAIHQVEKGGEYVDKELLREYIEKINAYNDVLGHWVKVRQGTVTLNIENFSLVPLLETLQRGYRAFESKNITLQVEVVDAVVKADKALTLFMMNTLLDNARKYTPEGGAVRLSLDRTDTYVEISVHDTGSGLSPEDLDKINNMKVYDSSQIGLANDQDGQIKQNKGFGFGLMNCRGIIEKYRKSGRIFDVCQFGVESQLGEGSRFFFRLPKGVMRNVAIVLMFLFGLNINAQTAVDYVDSLYQANIAGDYEGAVNYGQYAIDELNAEYQQQTGRIEPLMELCGAEGSYPELQWFVDSVQMDYTLIIQLRNELSLASLSLADRQLYRYNNEVFLRLNKLTSIDPNMEDVCRKLARGNADKNLIMVFSLIILLLAIGAYALINYHHTILPIFNMRLLVEFLKRMFSANEDQLSFLLRQGVSNIHPADAVNVTLTDGETYGDGEGECKTIIPLSLEFEGQKHDVGTMSIAFHGSNPTKEEHTIIDFIVQFVSIHIFFASIKVEQQQNKLELLEDQRFAAETEQQRLHVHNMVMDNCLSTIKHETMYYPNRILQLLDSNEDADLNEIGDVLKYYREVFGLLSENANRQLSRSIVKLQKVELTTIASYAKKSFNRQNKKAMLPIEFEVTGDIEYSVRGDIVLLQYMLDMLLSLVFETKTSGKVQLNFENSQGFIKFALSDDRLERSDDENSKLFYADSMYYDDKNDLLVGSQYLIAKQIIRDHDERLNHPGCRIYAEENKVVFTLPKS